MAVAANMLPAKTGNTFMDNLVASHKIDSVTSHQKLSNTLTSGGAYSVRQCLDRCREKHQTSAHINQMLVKNTELTTLNLSIEHRFI